MAKTQREIDRYVRMSWREQLVDAIKGLRGQHLVVGVVGVILVGWLILTVTRPANVRVNELAVGDCIYVPIGQSQDLASDIGSDADVLLVLYFQGAERAPCTGGHGHEVISTWTYPSEPVAFPGEAALLEGRAAACETAFTAYVGRPSEGSIFTFLPAAPDEHRWLKGNRTGVCLLHRRDKAFMTAPARNSNQ